MAKNKFRGNNAINRHPLLRLLSEIKKNMSGDSEFLAGYDYCRHMVIKFIKNNPSYNLAVDDFVKEEFARNYKKQLSKDLLHLVKERRQEEVEKILEKWAKLKY